MSVVLYVPVCSSSSVGGGGKGSLKSGISRKSVSGAGV